VSGILPFEQFKKFSSLLSERDVEAAHLIADGQKQM